MTAITEAIEELAPLVGRKAGCEAVGAPRATHYRSRKASVEEPPAALSPWGCEVTPAITRVQQQPRALSEDERAAVLVVLHSERFTDTAPASVYATLLDDGVYLASISTMYRLLRDRGETGDRRRHATHPAKVKPELVADRPNQVWSWDITKLHGPAKWTHFYLYVILDIFSRYPVGWMVASRESAVLAERLISEAVRQQNIDRNQLTLHADRGSSMASKPVAFLLADLGVTKSHSRPRVSNDNPYSEAQFKTLKYRPDFPKTFGCIEDSRVFCNGFFRWYAHEHRHSGLGLHTPADVHYLRAGAVRETRGHVLNAAYGAHPERFVRNPPQPPGLPTAAWINRPENTEPPTQK
ncbi:MAG: IS3 family transposase [Pseudonocardiales bacterium]|nr:MAG: IS3 family transposase [Pseudonocardiales bacterium]